MRAFKAYDIRGVYNRDFDGDDVYKIGFFLPKLLNTEKILVGFDCRTSSPEIFQRLCEGITEAGADVYQMGFATTPMVYYITASEGFEASVQITASHNSKECNGLKISRTNAFPVGEDTGLRELKRMTEEEKIVPVENKGTVHDYGGSIPKMVQFLQKHKKDISNLDIGIDCSNGMASLLVKQVIGNSPEYIFDTMDGTFPNHEPNPLNQKNVESLKNLILDKKLDIGVIFDGDADRVMFVDENGRFIPPDIITAVLAVHFFNRSTQSFLAPESDPPLLRAILEQLNTNQWVVHDIRTSRAVPEFIDKMGGKTFMWKVGHPHAKLKMRELDAVCGGELAGHYYFRDFYYCDSAMVACLIVLGIASEMKENGHAFSSLIELIAKYANSGEINFKIENKTEMMETLKEHFTSQEKPLNIYDMDGYRIEFPDWWFNIRPSNTEPYLRLVVEADTEELLNIKLDEIEAILNKEE